MLNKVILVGRMVRDSEIKSTTTGKSVGTFTLAVDRNFKNASGIKECDFIDIVVWGVQAESVGKFTSKGSLLGVSGRLQIRSYMTKEDQKRYVTEIVADEVSFLSSNQTPKQETTSREAPIDEADFAGADDSCPF